MLLQIENLHVYYGAIHALKGISLEVEEGEIVTLIGANGAGKSTTLKTISGLLRARQGKILFQGRDLSAATPPAIVSAGITQVPEGRRVFASLTVKENLEMGAFQRPDREVRESMKWVFELFPRLEERQKQLAGTLSGGEQQMLAVGRGLMARPRLMMLDEPSMGLAPLLVKEIFSVIREINQRGTTILLVEQNAHMALSIAHKGYVLETGSIALSGGAADLAANEQVRKAYLGG
ncbi:MAG: ABC transporter ATP-binding protein [Bacillota bacterium]|nr:ABC transporter ATP-binding protein [Bacillota bacterium]